MSTLQRSYKAAAPAGLRSAQGPLFRVRVPAGRHASRQVNAGAGQHPVGGQRTASPATNADVPKRSSQASKAGVAVAGMVLALLALTAVGGIPAGTLAGASEALVRMPTSAAEYGRPVMESVPNTATLSTPIPAVQARQAKEIAKLKEEVVKTQQGRANTFVAGVNTLCIIAYVVASNWFADKSPFLSALVAFGPGQVHYAEVVKYWGLVNVDVGPFP